MQHKMGQKACKARQNMIKSLQHAQMCVMGELNTTGDVQPGQGKGPEGCTLEKPAQRGCRRCKTPDGKAWVESLRQKDRATSSAQGAENTAELFAGRAFGGFCPHFVFVYREGNVW